MWRVWRRVNPVLRLTVLCHPSPQYEGYLPLHWAAENDSLEVAELLAFNTEDTTLKTGVRTGWLCCSGAGQRLARWLGHRSAWHQVTRVCARDLWPSRVDNQ